jgi:hypothetical protein
MLLLLLWELVVSIYGAANANGAKPMLLMRSRSHYCGSHSHDRCHDHIHVLLLLLLSHVCVKRDAVNAAIQYGKRGEWELLQH